MDDAARPVDDEGTDAAGVQDPATEASEDAQPRLDLLDDPFAPRFAVIEGPSEAPTARVESEIEPAADPDPAPIAVQIEPAADPDPAPIAADEDLSLDAMVSELVEHGDGQGPSSDTDAAPGSPTDVVADADADADADAEPEREPAVVFDAGEAPVLGEVIARRRLSTRLPFWIYGGLWAAFVAAMTYLLWPVSGTVFVDAPAYAYFVLGGAVLIVLGPFLGLTVWLAARASSDEPGRSGLGRAVSLRTAGWMAVGVVLWWAALFALDLHRAGALG